MKLWQFIACCTLSGAAYAYELPENLLEFYDTVFAQENCTNTLKSGFGNGDRMRTGFSYCEKDDVLFIHKDGGGLAGMAVDVDGNRPSGNNPPDSQDGTAFESILRSYNISGVTDLDPYIHPYVVFGNQGHKKGYETFHPQRYGVEPLSIMAVVCNKRLYYGIWGDTNGDDDWPPIDSVGEAAISTARACFGKSMTAENGHSKSDVLFVAFKGSDAVPGAKGADWAASSRGEFEKSIKELGDRLVARIGYNAGW